MNIGSSAAWRKYTISAGDGAVTLKVIQTPVYTWDVSDEADFQAGNGTWGENEYWSIDGTKLEPWPERDIQPGLQAVMESGYRNKRFTGCRQYKFLIQDMFPPMEVSISVLKAVYIWQRVSVLP